ncbi:hypothetical protein [Pectobacterium brasiliense]|uniref:hypothetical protein n=1 Tax=Pectobacterium brasiliense TaxID=180957 RepID=UPI0030CA5116
MGSANLRRQVGCCSALCARSPQEFYSLLCREHVTVLNQTPGAFRQLIAARDGADHTLRCIIFGGEARWKTYAGPVDSG